MEEEHPALAKFTFWDYLFTLVGLISFVADVTLDVWTTVVFYQEKDYVVVGVLVFILLGSSVLIHMYSWLWYSYDNYKMKTKVEGCVNPRVLKILHFLQMGVYLRYAGVLEVSMPSFCTAKLYPKDIAEYVSHDLRMLGMIEMFSESIPQIILMFTIIIRRNGLELITCLKAAASVCSIAIGMTTYRRSMRSFLSAKAKRCWGASLVYFLFNLLLIAPRVVALTLFLSVLPCYFPVHFLSLWMILFFCAWRSNTDFMQSVGGEWLYRATVGLIFYFCWFNMKVSTRGSTLLYYSLITIDNTLLYGLWYWEITTDSPYFDFPFPPYVVLIGMAVLYSTGLILRLIYYWVIHPKIAYKSRSKQMQVEEAPLGEDVVDGMNKNRIVNKRMRNLAGYFLEG